MLNDPSAFFNALICGVIVVALMFYQRGSARHRPLISLVAYSQCWYMPASHSATCSACITNHTGLWCW